MSKVPGAFRNFVLTLVIGGIAVGACVAALIPGVSEIAEAHHYTSDKIGALRDLAQKSTIYDSTGVVMGNLGNKNRELTTLDQVPKLIQNAVIAVEDKTFWENDGVDLNATMRALLKNLTSGEIEQGGSTITQQLVKNRILTKKRDINRKVREIVLAFRLNEKFSKNEILEQYLNTVYFGQGSYGIKSAAERFFLIADPASPYGLRPKTMNELSISEAALLAGLISNPEGNNPYINPEGAKQRRALALERMVDQGYITLEEAATATNDPLPDPNLKPVAELRPGTSWEEEIQDRLVNDPRVPGARRDPEGAPGPRAQRRAEGLRDQGPGDGRRRGERDGAGPAGEAGLDRLARRDGPEDRVREGDGRRARLRVEPVQHRHQLSRPPSGIDLEGHHAGRRARQQLLAGRHDRRHVAVRVRGSGPHAERRGRRRPHGAARRDEELGELRVRAARALASASTR